MQDWVAIISTGGAEPCRAMVKGVGNFSGAAIRVFLESLNYQCVSCQGNAADHTEFLCLALESRVVGAIWRIGGVGDGQDSNGHWVGMSYEHSSLLFSERRWHFKDSCKPGDVESLSSLEAMGKLEVPDKSGCGWFIVVDCA